MLRALFAWRSSFVHYYSFQPTHTCHGSAVTCPCGAASPSISPSYSTSWWLYSTHLPVAIMVCLSTHVKHFLCPAMKWLGDMKFLLCLSFRHSVPSSLYFRVLQRPSTDLNETLVRCSRQESRCACDEIIHVCEICQSYCSCHLEFLHILACFRNSCYIFAWIWMKLGKSVPQI